MPRARSRNQGAQYKASPEAFEATELETTLEKKIDSTVKPKVKGTSNPTTGKYAKKDAIRPTFGNVRTTTY